MRIRNDKWRSNVCNIYCVLLISGRSNLFSIEDSGMDGEVMTREEALQILDIIPTIGEQVDALEMAIKALEQEPKTGHWEWAQYDYNPKLGDWHCSECRSVVVECVSKEEKGGIPLYKYCPQCGAKMESEDEE